jgi:hypothetical protein
LILCEVPAYRCRCELLSLLHVLERYVQAVELAVNVWAGVFTFRVAFALIFMRASQDGVL